MITTPKFYCMNKLKKVVIIHGWPLTVHPVATWVILILHHCRQLWQILHLHPCNKKKKINFLSSFCHSSQASSIITTVQYILYICVYYVTFCILFTRHITGAYFPHYDPLGSGVIYPKSRASAHDVQPPSQAIRWIG